MRETGRLQTQRCRWPGAGLVREARLSPRPGSEAVPPRPRPGARLLAKRRGSGWRRPSRVIKISRLADNKARSLLCDLSCLRGLGMVPAGCTQAGAGTRSVSVRSCGREAPLPFVTEEGESMCRVARPRRVRRARAPSSEHQRNRPRSRRRINIYRGFARSGLNVSGLLGQSCGEQLNKSHSGSASSHLY